MRYLRHHWIKMIKCMHCFEWPLGDLFRFQKVKPVDGESNISMRHKIAVSVSPEWIRRSTSCYVRCTSNNFKYPIIKRQIYILKHFQLRFHRQMKATTKTSIRYFPKSFDLFYKKPVYFIAIPHHKHWHIFAVHRSILPGSVVFSAP